MKCECECRCGGILAHEALDDRLYWVEIITGPFSGMKNAAWRKAPEGRYQWTVVVPIQGQTIERTDDEIRVIHEIIPE